MIDKIKKFKSYILPILGVVLAAILVLFGGNDKKEAESVQTRSPDYESQELVTYTESLEDKIESFLTEIKGITNVSVILTVESSTETVYATQGTNSDYVVLKDSDGNENAIPLTEISAKIRGIAVACDYGGDETLKMTVIELLAALFDIGTNRISVLPA